MGHIPRLQLGSRKSTARLFLIIFGLLPLVACLDFNPEPLPIPTARPTLPPGVTPTLTPIENFGFKATEPFSAPPGGDITPLPQAGPSGGEGVRNGLTFGLMSHASVEFEEGSIPLDISRVGCYGRPEVNELIAGGPGCNPYAGDTSCALSLPILCLRPEQIPRPNYAVAESSGQFPDPFYDGWAGGLLRLSDPVLGLDLSDLEAANAICATQLGDNFRMAEFHDGLYFPSMDKDLFYGKTWPPEDELQRGGWAFNGYGTLPEESRFWVYIDDQPGNCWD